MTIENLKRANEVTRAAWNQNAAFWNERMGEGNDFVEVLIWPATEWLLELRPGERVLDSLEERAFPPDHPPGRNPLAWGANFNEIPPVLVARMRLPK